jgi:hypothetical protein
VDSLFTSAFRETRSSATVTSGDQETDQAIDLAVDTLFVEDVETPPPETAELEAQVVQTPPGAAEPLATLITSAQRKQREASAAGVALAASASSGPAAARDSEAAFDQTDEILELYRDTLFEEHLPGLEPAPTPPAAKPLSAVGWQTPSPDPADVQSINRLQEAILTLEWEISRRSVAVLASELQKVRARFQDNVTVDFAGLAMRLVLNYVVKRMSRAHPESVRFLLEVTRFLRGSVTSSREDPLGTFHQIVTLYERYKSVVRKAEGIKDTTPSVMRDLGIDSPDTFSRMVKAQAVTIATAGQSLASRIESTDDPGNLIRSFRFLVTRSVNRILRNTQKEKPSKPTDRKGRADR